MQQEVEILVSGRPVKQIAHEGRIFVVAKEGAEYEIKLRNRSTNRVTGVVAIDGLNVVDGEKAVSKGGGYIIPGYGAYTIKGYRTSNDSVHPFIFGKKESSYAEKSENGDVEDCGVIGVVFWAEKEKPQPIEKHIHHDHYYERPYYYPRPWHYPDNPYRKPYYWPDFWCSSQGLNGSSTTTQASNNVSYTSCLSNSNGDSSGILRSMNCSVKSSEPSAEFDMGTQFSEQSVSDHVETVDFEWGQNLGTIKIYYASREMLKKMGVPVDKESKVTFPEPFKDQGFCKPPKK